MSALPWFRFFPSEWISGASGLSAAERGVYVTLLALIYDKSGPIQRDDVRLSRQCGLPKAGFTRALEALIATGKIVEEDGCLFNSRAKTEISERENRAVMASKSASSQWEKRKQNQCAENAKALGGDSKTDATCARVLQPHSQSHTSLSDKTRERGGNARKARAAPAPIKISTEMEITTECLEVADDFGLTSVSRQAEWRAFLTNKAASGVEVADLAAAFRQWCGKIDRFGSARIFTPSPSPAQLRQIRVWRHSPQGEAWEAHYRAERRKIPWNDGAWWFPTEWPTGAGEGQSQPSDEQPKAH